MWMGWEDLEYGWRLFDHGYRQMIVCEAVYRDNYEYQETWVGKTIDKPVSRTFYTFRNLILAIRRSRSRPSFYVVAIYRMLLELMLIVLVRDSKWPRLRNLCKGVWSGFIEALIVENSIPERPSQSFIGETT
jgi:GT2 family glycosyltransferase